MQLPVSSQDSTPFTPETVYGTGKLLLCLEVSLAIFAGSSEDTVPLARACAAPPAAAAAHCSYEAAMSLAGPQAAADVSAHESVYHLYPVPCQAASSQLQLPEAATSCDLHSGDA